MKTSDEDLLLLWDAATRTGKSSVECAWHELKDELRALRKVAEAARRGGWVCDDDCPADCHGKQLSDALKEAGYDA